MSGGRGAEPPHWAGLVPLVGGAVAIRLGLFFGGVRGSDAYAYAHQAYNLAMGQYDVQAETMFYGFRYTVLLPTALAYRLFGVNDWSSAMFPLLASLATLGVVVALGSALLDRRTGLLAGVLYVFFPLDLPAATLLGPDSFIPLLAALAFFTFWAAGEAALPVASRAGLYVTAGVCIGLAAQARESSLLLVASAGLVAWYQRRRDPVMALTPLGCLAPLVAESWFYWRETGDPAYRLTVIHKLNELYVGSDPEGPTSWAYYLRGMFGVDLGGFAWFGFFVYLAAGGLILAVMRGEVRRLAPLLLWAAPPVVYLEFGSMSLLRYVPIVKNYHYLSIASAPLVLLGAYALSALPDVVERWGREPAGQGPRGTKGRRGVLPSHRDALVAAVVAVLAATSLYGISRVRENILDDARPYEVVAKAVAARPELPIYVPHERWAMFLSYHLRYRTNFNYYSRPSGIGRGRLHYLWEAPTLHDLPSCYVVAHDRYLYFDTIGRPVGRASRLPSYVFDPPQTWRVVMRERANPAYNSFTLYETDRGPCAERRSPCPSS